MPLAFWPDALSTATYLLNQRPCIPCNHVTPFFLLFGSAPDYSHLRIFGCLCFPNTTATTPHKLAPRSVPCVFLGYPDNIKGYRCYDPITHRVLMSWHVVFDECVFPFRQVPPTPASALPAPPRLIEQVPVVVHPTQRQPAGSSPPSSLQASPSGSEPPTAPSTSPPPASQGHAPPAAASA